ncbi:MAG TPA: DUF2723 domain-containing protein [Gemmatimonadales bacterium]|jgi:hypothetical protein
MDSQPVERPPYGWALATFAIILAIYMVTLSPTTAMWDASEYISSAYVLGVPHPPGNPLFTLMAHAWGLLPLASEYARRINIFAAVTSAASAGLWFLVAERWLRSLLPERAPRLMAAFAGILASATAWTVWNQSTVSEKVYTVSMLSIALVAWFAIRWADEPAGHRRDRWLIAALYILALSSTNHTMGLLGAPVLVVYVALTDWRVVFRPTFIAMAIGVVILGVTPNYLYLPIRAGQHPAINEGEASGFFSPALMATLNRTQYLKPPLLPRQPYAAGDLPQNAQHLAAQIGMYLHYWTWQWGKDLGGWSGLATALFTALGLGGLWTLLKRDRRAGLAALALVGTLTVLLIFYLNFKFGYYYHQGDASITNDMREVRDRDYFFIASFAFAGVLIAAGFAALLLAVTRALRERSPRFALMAATPLLLLALIPLYGNRVSAPRNHETLTRDYAIDVLQSVEPYGILITAGDNDTFPLWYAQEVLGVRRDVTLANLSLMGTDWHVRQLERRVTPAFDLATAAPIWRQLMSADTAIGGGSPDAIRWQQPHTPALTETIAQLDAIPQWNSFAPGTAIQAGDLTIRFAHDDAVTRSDVVAALLIHDNVGKRPVYFSSSTADYPDVTLGLAGHLVTQGLVRKVVADSVHPGRNVVGSEYLGAVDTARTSALLFHTYHVATITRPRPGGWYDPPSSDMLEMYLRLYATYVPVLQQFGDSGQATRANDIALKVRQAIIGK